jgi:hypothetical protein
MLPFAEALTKVNDAPIIDAMMKQNYFMWTYFIASAFICAAGGCGKESGEADGSIDAPADLPADSGTDGTVGELPSGNNGIAARYPGTESGNVYAGSQSLEFYNPQQDQELSNTVARELTEELDVLFLRYYSKFDESFDVTGSSHNGGGMSAHYFIDGQATPGVPADGTNKFLAEFECWRGETTDPSPGRLNIYIYHPEQRSQWGDHFFPTGVVLPNSSVPGNFGDEFVARPDIVPQLGRWYSYEVMVKANTPGLRDGRIACWLDGEMIADFTNLRLRDVDTLKIDRFNLSLHIGSNTAGETWKWYDNVVAATSYIGPVFQP